MKRFLDQRALGEHQKIEYKYFSLEEKTNLNTSMNKIGQNLDEFQQSLVIISTKSLAIIKEKAWTRIERALILLSEDLLDSHHHHDNNTQTLNKKKLQEKEIFISLGGCHELLKLLDHPFNSTSSSIFLINILRKHADIWNITLVTLREICSTCTTIGETLFTNSHIIFLFQLLNYTSLFENALILIEEILASKSEIFNLNSIPNFYNILKSFTTRQLAHFCRVLALLLFEPEDRHILEGVYSLNSIDLLQLRRNKLSKPSYIVERNQNLLLEMSHFLPRMCILFHIINYAPNLFQLIQHKIMIQASLFTYEILYHILGIDESESDWDYFDSLITIVQNNHTSKQTSCSTSTSTSTNLNDDAEDLRVRGLLLDAFTPNMSVNNSPSMDMSNIFHVLNAAYELGITTESSTSISLTALFLSRHNNNNVNNNRQQQHRRRYSLDSASEMNKTVREAKNELLFHSMILVPHQVEVTFVMCTLLSGRRKLYTQKTLHQLHMSEILINMFTRMSWDTPFTYDSPRDGYHQHGPNCECTPEAPLRVQYLRLVHNYYDCDFQYSPHKVGLLSSYEQSVIQHCMSNNISEIYIPNEQKGLLSLLIGVLKKESNDSLYIFWLSSCVEVFLRGSQLQHQIFVANGGLMKHIVHETILAAIPSKPSKSQLQTSFDLLGEMIKNNRENLAAFESLFNDATWLKFSNALLGNLVDSNVFIRALYLTVNLIEESSTQQRKATSSVGYCSHSWVHLHPIPLQQLLGTPTTTSTTNQVEVEGDTIPMSPHNMNMNLHNENTSHIDILHKINSNNNNYCGIERIYEFITLSKEIIILKLVCAVTIHTINHENICCVNSALFILLFELQKNNLAQCMSKFRQLTETEIATAQTTTAAYKTNYDQDSADNANSINDSQTNTKMIISTEIHIKSDNVILVNFRQVLWFWREYYQHRGRDRLSLEFSSCRIAFPAWKHIVDLLCQDDGSPYAILTAPISTHLPLSPYGRPGKQLYLPRGGVCSILIVRREYAQQLVACEVADRSICSGAVCAAAGGGVQFTTTTAVTCNQEKNSLINFDLHL